MEDVIDCIHSPCSPEELAIHFLMRHTACRRALTELANSELLHQTAQHSPRDASDPNRTAADFRQPPVPPSEVTTHDSCAARFSRAYAAARHTSTSRTA